MKFDLTNFLELDTKALMAINGGGTCGGGSCSSGGSSYSGGGSCSSSSSYGGSCGSGSYGGSCSGSYGGSCGGGSSYGGSCGGKNVVVKPYNPTPSEPDANLTLPPTDPEGNFVENSNYGVANAKPGDKLKRKDGTIVILTPGDIEWAKAQLEKEAASNPVLEDNITDDSTIPSENDVTTNPSVEEPPTSPTEDLTNPKPSGSPSNNNTTPATSSEDKISKSIQENWNKEYNYDKGYRCDNWVEEVLADAGYDSSEYLTAGNSYQKTVQQHIDALTSSKTEGVDYTKTLPTADGAYVVFMDDSSIGYAEHAAILVIENGVATLYDNSSGRGNAFYREDEAGNVLKDKDGNPYVSYYDQGVASEKVYGKNNGTKLLDYGYDTFYYQKIQ